MKNELINILYKYLSGNPNVYAEQTENGYNTIYKPFTENTIKRMIDEKQSFLTYQFIGENVKWICFDFDILKETTETPDYKNKKQEYHSNLLKTVKVFCEKLDLLKITYLAEFSGNRGFHIWVVFEKPVTGYIARQILLKIKNETNLQLNKDIFGLDEFPKKSSRNGKIGYGVKLPLSLHKKSNSYSFLFDIQKVDEQFDFSINIISDKLEKEQLEILNSFKPLNVKNVIGKFKINIEQEQKEEAPKYVKSRKPALKEKATINQILADLKKCNIINPIVEKYEKIVETKEGSLNEKERAFLVGLLNRLQIESDKSYGKKILKDFFSKLPNYREKLTEKKLDNLNFYPLTCNYLKTTEPKIECPCKFKKNEEIYKTPIELIENIDIDTLNEDIFEIWDDDLMKIINSQINYIKYNDEIDLTFQFEELNQLNIKEFISKYLYYIDNPKSIDKYYEYKRIEDDDKERNLVSLSVFDKLLTTAYTKVLDSIHFTERSDNSYGYKFSNSFTNYQLFEPWLKQWNIYIKGLDNIIFNSDFKDYYIIKLDLKSFYSEIDLNRLKIKLLKGANKSIKEKIEELDYISKKRYYNVCNTLISFCYSIADKGVPQGPAFAKYLAEIYLMQIDEFIEKQLMVGERYFRYVDDIFIFLNRDEKTSKKILDNFTSFINTHNLSINHKNEKYFFGNILDYQDEFSNYKDKTKYFIDSSYKNNQIISTTGTKHAIKDMFSLIDDKQNNKIKNENLNFFFTHFDKSLLVHEKKKELEKYVLNSLIGRGSLFRNFYNFYFEQLKEEKTILHDEIYNLSGLNRGVFLNKLLKFISENKLTDNLYEKLDKIIKYFFTISLNDYEIEILIHIMFKNNKLLNKKYFNKNNLPIIQKVIETNTEKKVPNEIIVYLLDNLQHIELSEKISLIFRIIFNNKIENKIFINLRDLFFNTVLEDIGSSEPETYKLTVFKNVKKKDQIEKIYQYYQLLCLFSITKSQTPKHQLENLKHLWTNFMSYTNDIEIKFVNHQLNWVKQIAKIELNENIANAIIASKPDDTFIDNKKDKSKLFANFYNGVIYSVYFKAQNTKNIDLNKLLSKEAKEAIKELIEKENLIFLKWLQDKRTRLYPNKEICLQNIIENERLVLKRDNEILVRIKTIINKNETRPNTDYSYIKVEEILEKNEHFKSVIYKLPATYKSIINIIKQKDNLIEVIESILSIKKSIYEFKVNYHPEISFFPNIINGDINMDFQPLIPYSIFDKKPVISEQKIDMENNEGKFLGNLLSFLKSTELNNLSLLGYKHPNSLKGNQIIANKKNKSDFIPISFKNDISATFEYLENFIEFYKTIKPEFTTAFHLEYSKLHTVYQLLKQKQKQEKGLSDTQIIPKLLYDILLNYHIMYQNKDYHKKLIFDIFVDINNDTLFSLYNSLSKSIGKFVSELDTNINIPINSLFYYELIKIEEICVNFWKTTSATELSIKTCDFNTELDINKIELNEIKNFKKPESIDFENDTRLTLNRKTIFNVDDKEQNNVYIFKIFNEHEYKIDRLKVNDIHSLLENEVYFKKVNETTLLIIVDNVIQKSYETIKERQFIYNERNNNTREFHIDCFEYPFKVDEIINNNKDLFDKSIKVLSDHYYNSPDFNSEEELKWHLRIWLRLFSNKPNIVRALLEVISSHKTITQKNIQNFITEIKRLQTKKTNIFFSIKELKDMNGLHRLLTQMNIRDIFNSLDIKNIIVRNKSFKNSTLVLLADIGISGNQMKNGLDYYYKRNEFENKTLKKAEHEQYFDITEQEINDFRKKLNQFDKIHFVLAAYTEKFKETVEQYIHDKINKNIKITFFPERPNLKYNDCLLEGYTSVKNDTVREFKTLIANIEYLKSAFEFDKNVLRKYEKNIKDNELNLLVRLHSVSKKTIMLFNLKPRNNTKSLFKRLE